jgi:hypothetical protein
VWSHRSVPIVYHHGDFASLIESRRGGEMTQLEFWNESADQVVATVSVRDQNTMPSVGDLVYVPDEKDSGVYAYLKVVSRRFYYSQTGELTMIRLACEAMQ